MVRMFCDKCGKDCDAVAFDVAVTGIENPVPLSIFSRGEPRLSCTNNRYRFMLCQTCYRKMGFPNIFKVMDDGELEFRDEEAAHEES